MKRFILKEFNFLKSITSNKDLKNASIDLDDNNYFIPISKCNYLNYSKLIPISSFDEFFDSESILFVCYNKIKISFVAKLLLTKDNKLMISLIDLRIPKIDETVFYDFIQKLKNIYLVEIIFDEKDLFLSSLIVKKKIEVKKMILTAGPSITQREKIYVNEALLNGWNSKWGSYLTAFEKEFAKYIGVKYAISTSSCTGAMHIALMALGIGKGDEVIVPDITWVSTANAVKLVGAIPVFADVNLSTWTIDGDSIESLITNKTKAIMPVHLYGHPCEMDEIMDLSEKYNLKIVEDAAPSIGAEYKTKKTGSFGDFSAFSFQGAKLLVTGEGGMLCTNDEALYKKAYKIWDQGRIPGSFWIEELGVKYKMSNIQAALGLAQLERNDLMVEAKRNINNLYFNKLGNHSKIKFFIESDNARSIHWMTNIRLVNTNLTREYFCKNLKEKLIDTRPVFPSISQYPYWPKKQNPQPNSKLIAETGINLPSGVCLSKEQIDYVCDNIIEILDNE